MFCYRHSRSENSYFAAGASPRRLPLCATSVSNSRLTDGLRCGGLRWVLILYYSNNPSGAPRHLPLHKQRQELWLYAVLQTVRERNFCVETYLFYKAGILRNDTWVVHYNKAGYICVRVSFARTPSFCLYIK